MSSHLQHSLARDILESLWGALWCVCESNRPPILPIVALSIYLRDHKTVTAKREQKNNQIGDRSHIYLYISHYGKDISHDVSMICRVTLAGRQKSVLLKHIMKYCLYDLDYMHFFIRPTYVNAFTSIPYRLLIREFSFPKFVKKPSFFSWFFNNVHWQTVLYQECPAVNKWLVYNLIKYACKT